MSNTFDNDFVAERGPFIVLSDGSIFDDALDCEIAYLTRLGEREVIDNQNRGWQSGIGTHFDAVDPLEVYSIPLLEIIRYYFDNHPEKDPMK